MAPWSMTLRTWFTGNLWEPLFWRVKDLPVTELFKKFSIQQWDSVEVFQSRQEKMLAALLRHSLKNIPFYQAKNLGYKDDEIEDQPYNVLRSWPILEKEDLRSSLSELYQELARGTFGNSTGSSTGTPVTLYQDKPYQAATLAAIDFFYEWAGRPPGSRLIKIWGAQRDITHGGQGLRFRLGNFLGNRLIFNCFSMTPAQMQQFLQEINRFKPLVIEGYVDGLFELAKFIHENGLKVKPPLRGVISSAGTLLPHMRAPIEEAFKTRVFNRYGSREAGPIGEECSEHKGLHVMGETTVVEVVDTQGIPVPAEEEGDILITNLWNYTMPLIRYRIGDRGILSEKRCSCGRPYPLLKQVTGRSSESFVLKDGTVISPAFFIHFIGVVHNDGSIAKFQVVQKAFDHVVIRLVPKADFNLQQWPNRTILMEHIHNVLGKDCRIDFSIEKDIEKTPTGKHLYTVRQT
jgi:phenylacetate-CoA ligase